MSTRAAKHLAVAGLAASAVLALATVGILVAGGVPLGPVHNERDLLDGATTLLLLVYPAVGAVLAAKLPANPLGWILLGAGLAEAAHDFADVYAHHAYHVDPGSLPAPGVVAVIGDALWMPGIVLGLCFVLLLFPDGRLPSPRWRIVAWTAAVAGVGSVPVTLFLPAPLFFVPEHPNPLGWEAATSVLEVLRMVSGSGLAVALVAMLIAVPLRVRRARGIERQQVKWFLAAVGAVALTLPFAAADEALLASVAFDVAVLLVPVSIGVAVLRYRLYDLDRLIRRTVTYALVTGALVATYAGAVVLLQQAAGPLTAGSDLAVAAATLLAAALFRPVLSRTQRAVDRRFDRGRIDAARTVESFGARLRDDVDLGSLRGELRSTAVAAVQPTSVTVWLRP